MVHLIPLIVTGGVIGKFSDKFLGQSKGTTALRNGNGKKTRTKTTKPSYPSGKYRPF